MLLRKCIKLSKYIPGKSIEEVKRKYGLERVVKLASNENPYGPSPKAIEAFRSYSDLHIYPDPEYRELREKISEYTGWDVERIVVGAGIDGILETLFKILVDEGDEVVIPIPSFPYYSILTMLSCGKEVIVRRGENYQIDQSIFDVINEKTKLILISNPNNPTGNAERVEIVEEIVQSTDGIVFIDEAYVEFSDFPVNIDAENVVIARTFSKAFGLANLRVGYALLPEWLVDPFKAAMTPFPLSTPAVRAAEAAIDDIEWMRKCVEKIKEERERMFRELKKCVEVTPSQANFLFFESPVENLAEELLKRGVIVRDCSNFPGCRNHIRVTVGKAEENEMFLQALKEVLEC